MCPQDLPGPLGRGRGVPQQRRKLQGDILPDGLFQPPRGVIGLDLDLRDGDLILLLLLNADAGQCACAGVDLLVSFQGERERCGPQTKDGKFFRENEKKLLIFCNLPTIIYFCMRLNACGKIL